MMHIKTILTALASVILACVITACTNHTFSDIPEQVQPRPSMSITIAMSGISRAGDTEFEPGEGFENYLDITTNKNYRIYFFNDDNSFFGTFNVLVNSYIGSNDGNTVFYYRFKGEAPDKLPEKFKLVTLFNWPKYPQTVKISDGNSDREILKFDDTIINNIEDLCTQSSAQFTALTSPDKDGSWLDDKTGRLIPFYGVREYDLTNYLSETDKTEEGDIKGSVIIDLSKDKDMNPTELPIIRAMAKVEVILNNPMASFEEVSMTKVNSKGFCAPYKNSGWTYDYTDYYHDYKWDMDFVRGVHLTNGATTDNKGKGTNDATPASLNFKKVTADGVKPEKWVAYVPEYKNIGVENYTSIRVKLKNPDAVKSNDDTSEVEPSISIEGDNTSYYNYIYFADYKNGQATTTRFDIERNNIYRFTITGMNAGMDISAEIQPFAEQKLTFGFGLMRDSRGDLMVVKIPERDATGKVMVDEKGDTIYTYPQYFLDFVQKHDFPKEIQVDSDGNILKDEAGNILYKTTEVKPTAKGDYYAIVVGEYESLSEADVWVKDKDGCHVLTNFGKTVDNSNNSADHEGCNSRLVEMSFGNNQSEIFYKDKFHYRRVHHFDNHNSIVRHPVDENLLFCVIDNFGSPDEIRKYYEVESWDGETGWIIVYDENNNETGDFRQITYDGNLGQLYSEILSTDQSS